MGSTRPMVARATPLPSKGTAATAPALGVVGEEGGVAGVVVMEVVVQSRPRMTDSSVSCRPMVETSAM